MNVGMELLNKDSITSLELCEQINIFRQQEGRSKLAHGDLLKVIRDEFEEEIGQGKISLSEYLNSQSKKQPMYILTLSQAKQVLVREHKTVRKAVIKYIETLEEKLKKMNELTPYEKNILVIANDNSSVEAKVEAGKAIRRIGRAEICDRAGVTLDAVAKIIQDVLQDEECLEYMSLLNIRDVFKDTLQYLGYIYWRKFPSKKGTKLEKQPTMTPTEKFDNYFVQMGYAKVRIIEDDREKPQIEFNTFIRDWFTTNEFKDTFVKLADVYIPKKEENDDNENNTKTN